MPIETTTFVLGEPRIGHTGYVAGRFFVDGQYTQPFPSKVLQDRALKFCSSWNAHCVNSEEGKAILKEHYGKPLKAPKEEAPKKSEETPPVDLEDVEVNEKLVAAIEALDHSNDSHWTQSGLPAISAVEEMAASSGFTRKDIEIAAPGLVRIVPE